MKKYTALILAVGICLLTGCGKPEVLTGEEPGVSTDSSAADLTEENLPEAKEAEPVPFLFRDVFGEEYTVMINPDVPEVEYNREDFVKDGDKMAYVRADYTYKLGVDVSHHQGYIDWEKVKEAGYDFVILRIGYRGYGKEGNIRADKEFENNYKNATAAGLDVGVYFFAQAINEDEAAEEAEFVLSILSGRKLQLPVVYDPESILDDEARTDNVTGEQFTKNTAKFCSVIEASGYEPMIYSNMLWEAYNLDLSELHYPIWYADYEDLPQTPYHFNLWQYSSEGRVNGISGNVDLDILLIKR